MISESNLRPILGAYINLARNNFFTTLKHINTAVGASGGVDDNEAQMYLMSILKSTLTPEQEDRARRLFFLHFPFLKYLSSDKEDLTVSFGRMRTEIISCANVLSWYRNIYSHSRAKERRSDPKKSDVANNYERLRWDELRVCRLMAQTATVSARIIKERYSTKNESQKGMLADDSMNFINRDRYRPSRGSDGRRTMILNESHFLYPMRKGDPLPCGENPERLSVSGKIQLICLFLEKKYITEFLSQTKFLSDFSDNAQAPLLSKRRLALDTISALRVRLPESRIQSDRDETQVALDILGELKKCPAEIYELLSAKDKSVFSVQSSTGETVLLRRSSDRFVPLALSFLDTTEAFPNLRFQVNAGTFRYLFKEDKKCVDGQERMRVLQEPLNCFGRIQEVEAVRKAKDGRLWKEYRILGFKESARNDKSCLPYISDVYTRYVVNGDNIGMRLDGTSIPEIKLRDDGIRYDVPCLQADCTISRFNLQAMLFYHLLRPMAKNAVPSAEELVCRSVEAYKHFFSDIVEGHLVPISGPDAEKRLLKILFDSYGIKLYDIPEKLKDYLLCVPDRKNRFEKHKKNLIKKMLEDTQRRLERIIEQRSTIEENGSENKPGKKGYVQIKPGGLASYLAEDIALLQDCEDKLTGLNYAVMQGTMATFSTHEPNGKGDLIKIFKNAGLISIDGKAGSHPFLWAVMKEPTVTGTVNLYIKYLRAKIDYLKKSVADNAPFLHSERKRWEERNVEYYKDLAKRYLSQPVALTGSVFEGPVKDILMNLKNEDLSNTIEKSVSNGRCNMAYMIQQFQDIVLEDTPQRFYGLVEGDMEHDPNYKLYGLARKYPRETIIIRDKPDTGTVFKATLNRAILWVREHPEETAPTRMQNGPRPAFEEIQARIRAAYKEFTETEKLIRRLATQDTLLFMASSSLIKKILGLPREDTSMKQYQIGLPEEKGILDMRLPKVVKNVRFDWKDSTRNDDPLAHKNASIEAEDICIKDYGDIFRIINDRRVASLVHHLNISSISIDDLRKELDCYDNRRVDIFRDIFEYEDKVLGSVSVLPETLDFDAVQKCDTTNSPEDKFAAGIIRNSFCHNFYPTRTAGSKQKKVQDVVIIDSPIPDVAESMASRLANFSKKTQK